MLGRRGGKAMHRMYPTLSRLWALNGNRASRGLPPLPVPSVASIKAPKQ